MADEVVASGKSKYEVAYMLMRDLLLAKDGPKHSGTRNDILDHYEKARSLVYGNIDARF